MLYILAEWNSLTCLLVFNSIKTQSCSPLKKTAVCTSPTAEGAMSWKSTTCTIRWLTYRPDLCKSIVDCMSRLCKRVRSCRWTQRLRSPGMRGCLSSNCPGRSEGTSRWPSTTWVCESTADRCWRSSAAQVIHKHADVSVTALSNLSGGCEARLNCDSKWLFCSNNK